MQCICVEARARLVRGIHVGLTNDPTARRPDDPTNERRNQLTHERTNERTDERTDGRTDVSVEIVI